MKINLECARRILRECLGFDSFTAGFIRSVDEDPDIPTAGISEDGRLSYNPGFVKKHVSCKEDLFGLVFHELLHPMFNHFIYDNGEVENIAADAIINAVISTIYCRQSRDGNLFKKFYRKAGVQGLLRPDSQMSHSRFEKVYDRLYGYGYSSSKMTTGELITTLKVLLDSNKNSTITLLGSHNTGDMAGGRLPREVCGKIAQEIKKSASANISNTAGHNSSLIDLFMEALRTHLCIKQTILRKYATHRKLDKFKQLLNKQQRTVSPVPLYPSKRDLILLASNIYPGCFHNQITRPYSRNRGLAIYLDVSGSVDQYLPKILGILQNLKREITSIFLFSNKVYEVGFKNLLRGELKTTGGTDFDCIAESILERQLDKAIIITDGCASMSKASTEKLAKHKITTLTILFDRAQTCRAFEVFGDIVRLEDVIN